MLRATVARALVAPAFAAVLLGVLASSASAQVIYEPVQYQYGAEMKYYYGGSDPGAFAYADRVLCRNGFPTAANPHYTSLYNTLGQIGERKLVLSDCMPFRNAAVFGYTANDAHNEANANVPQYYRKRDILAAAVPAADGTLVVSAQAHPLPNAAMRDMRSATGVEPKPRAILILPKKAPAKQGDAKQVNLVAAAQ